jgi:O-acetyl-ADP-ribose deacetylase (regulator of RNase III)
MKIRILTGDICSARVDGIVNAANNQGLGGGGVDGAIHRAAGSELREACADLPLWHGLTGYGPGLTPAKGVRVPDGGAVPTPAFQLFCRWVIHTAGPVWPSDPNDEVYVAKMVALAGVQMKVGAVRHQADDLARQVLRDCYKMPALVALGMGLKSLAYPAISTGVYGCPQETCAQVALGWVKDYLDWPLDVSFYIFPETPNLAIWQSVATKADIPFIVEPLE